MPLCGARENPIDVLQSILSILAQRNIKNAHSWSVGVAIQSLKGENEEFEINVVKICQRHSQPSQQLISTAYGIINNSNPRMKQPHDIFNSVEVSCIGN